METINHNKLNTYPRYLKYKDSGIDWIGEIPEGWAIGKGFTIFKERKKLNAGLRESQVLSLSYGKIIIKPKDKLFGLVPESFETYQIVDENDIIIRCTDLQNDRTSLRIGISKNKGIITSAYLNLCVKSNYLSDYFYRLLHTFDVCKAIYKFGTGLRQNLSFIDFKKMTFPIPPLAEQQQIADFLDNKTALIDEAIGLKQQQIDKLKEYKQITIQTAVTRGLNPNAPMKNSGIDWIGEIPEGWEVKRLKNFAKIYNGATPSSSVSAFWDGEIIWVTPVDINDIKYISNSERKITIAGYKSCGTTLVPSGSLIITCRAPIGKITIAKETLCTNQGCKSIVLNKEILTKFVYYYFCTQTEILNSLGSGTTFLELNSFALKNFPIPIPPLAEQQQIADYLEQKSAEIDATIAYYQEQIDKLKEYKTVLIQAAVTGQIKVSQA